jgi:hypothetical protein
MTERMINAAHDNHRKFAIPANPDLLKDFPDQDEILVVLSDKAVNEQDVFYKPVPVSVKNLKYKAKKVHWVNNFGIKTKNAKAYETRVSQYEIHLKHVDGAVYVYYDGKVIQPLTVTSPVDGLVSAQLDLGDPPLGWVK